MDKKLRIQTCFHEAESQGSWAQYAVYKVGNINSGDAMLDRLLNDLFNANEAAHYRANSLAADLDIEFFDGD